MTDYSKYYESFNQTPVNLSEEVIKDRLIDEAGDENLDAVVNLPLTKQAPPPESLTESEALDKDYSLFEDLGAIPEQAFFGSARALRNQGRFLKSGLDFVGQNVDAFAQASAFIDSIPDTPEIPDAPENNVSVQTPIEPSSYKCSLPVPSDRSPSSFPRQCRPRTP